MINLGLRSACYVFLPLLCVMTACSATGSVREERSGIVRDSETTAPLAGVGINVETWMVQRPDMRPVQVWKRYDTVTAEDGTWTVPSNSDWPSLNTRTDPIPVFMDRYEFSKSGYHTRTYGPRRGSVTRWQNARVPTTLMMDRAR